MRSKIHGKIILFIFFLCFSGFLFPCFTQELKGKVIDKAGNGVEGARVVLVKAQLSTNTGVDGAWAIRVATPIHHNTLPQPPHKPALKGDALYFFVPGGNQTAQVHIYTLDNKRVSTILNKPLSAGGYSLNSLTTGLKNGTYILKLIIGGQHALFKLPVVNTRGVSQSLLRHTSDVNRSHPLTKTTAIIDTVKVTKSGYIPMSVPIESLAIPPMTIILTEEGAFYHRDPPDPCRNQFYVKGCQWNKPETTCGGVCATTNSCSPPEDPSKKDLEITFLCPRFMLFSREMVQAAKDDAKLYNWGDDQNTPFNYAIVGHDADPGGLDDGVSSCCQCYQLIFEDPEPSSPKPPQLPYPKSLVVQSFNTAASGPTGFDLFMGAGGYGAFNACYDDPAFSGTTKFGKFIYDAYPYQNPNSGGISFLRFPACIGKWPPTVAALQSAACQDQITGQCNQALVKASPEITEDTKLSCIQSNQPSSLYHQNWKVRAKRVRCPDNLTRVTGCRLKEENLPLPAPDIQTPAQADKDNTFKKGYHTTTMQDCCKPTCAWQDWVGGQGLPADGEWNSFYSCDQNGKVLTK